MIESSAASRFGHVSDSMCADEAMARWPLTGLTVVHRVGRITPGENIVVVLAASQHRQAAFQAAFPTGPAPPDVRSRLEAEERRLRGLSGAA